MYLALALKLGITFIWELPAIKYECKYSIRSINPTSFYKWIGNNNKYEGK